MEHTESLQGFGNDEHCHGEKAAQAAGSLS